MKKMSEKNETIKSIVKKLNEMLIRVEEIIRSLSEVIKEEKSKKRIKKHKSGWISQKIEGKTKLTNLLPKHYEQEEK